MQLRQASIGDDEFCLRLNEAALREYIEPIYGWNPDFQRRHHADWFDPDRLSIIQDDAGKPVGVLDVSDEGDYLYLARLELVPEAQGHGVGTAVVRDLLQQGLVVRLHVLSNNTGARRFYERLGFAIDQDAERKHHVSMHHTGAIVGET